MRGSSLCLSSFSFSFFPSLPLLYFFYMHFSFSVRMYENLDTCITGRWVGELEGGWEGGREIQKMNDSNQELVSKGHGLMKMLKQWVLVQCRILTNVIMTNVVLISSLMWYSTNTSLLSYHPIFSLYYFLFPFLFSLSLSLFFLNFFFPI